MRAGSLALVALGCRFHAVTVVDSVDVTLVPEGPTVIDPKSGGALRIEADVLVPDEVACDAAFFAEARDGTLATGPEAAVSPDARARWDFDGIADDGLPFDPGPIRVWTVVTCDDGARTLAELEVGVVRLGVVEVDVVDHPTDHGAVMLAYHKLDGLVAGISLLDVTIPEYRSHALTDGADLDDDHGVPRPVVAPWDDPDAPPWGWGDEGDLARNVPAGVVAGKRIGVMARVGRYAVSERTGLVVDAFGPLGEDWQPVLRLVGDVPVRIGAEEGLAPGMIVPFEMAAPEAVLGRVDVALGWRFQQATDDGWVDVATGPTTDLRLYRFAGPPALRDGTDVGAAPPVPWIGTLEDVDAAVSGLPPEAAPVLDALRDWLHDDPYLVYDPSVNEYSGYEGPYIYWDYAWSELGEWLERWNGLRLYCHSLSCLLSVLAGTVGVDAPQQVLGVGFYTNYLRAAGTDTWARYGFNSHSVVSPDGGATIWDASVDLDGDENPGEAPSTGLPAKGIPGEEYLWRLSGDPVSIVNDGQCYVY